MAKIGVIGDATSILGFKAFGLDVPLATELGLELRASGLDVPQDILTDDELTSALVTLADYPHGLTDATREGRG